MDEDDLGDLEELAGVEIKNKTSAFITKNRYTKFPLGY